MHLLSSLLCLLVLTSNVFAGTIISVANITDTDFSIVAINPGDGNYKLLKKIPYALPSHQPIDDTILCNDQIFALFINDPKKVITYDLRSNQYFELISTDYVLSAQFSQTTKQLLAVTIDNSFVEIDCMTMKTKNVLAKTLPKSAEQMKSSTITSSEFVVAVTDTTQAGLPSSFVNVDFRTGNAKIINHTCGFFADIQFDHKRVVNYGILASLDQVTPSNDRLMRVDVHTGKCDVVCDDLSAKLNITKGMAIYGAIGFDVNTGDQGSYLFGVYDQEKHRVSTIVFDIKQKIVRGDYRLPGATLGKAQFLNRNL
jgi:hypothetical protein